MAEEMLYEGKAKQIFTSDDNGLVRAHFKDDATAFDGDKKGQIVDKGIVNASMSAALFEQLEQRGIPTHFKKRLGERDLLVERVEIILIEVIVRNIAAGSLCRRLGLEQGQELKPPLLEWFYKNDDLHDPLITEDHVYLLNLATSEELQKLRTSALEINSALQDIFAKVGITLVDFKLEFGRRKDGSIVLADEISPDTCRLWDTKTGKVLDKDRFRFDMGDVEDAYQEVMQRIGVRL